MAEKKKLHIPFDKAGNMLTYSYSAYPETGTGTYYDAHEWRDNTPFTETLRLDRFQRGRSAAHFILVDPPGP